MIRRAAALALAVGLAACGRIGFRAAGDGGGDGGGAGDDGAAGDADTTAQLVATVHDSNGAVANALVWTNRATGEVDDIAHSDASGLATLHVETGGTVTAVFPATLLAIGPTIRVESVVGVAPGDVIPFGEVVSPCDRGGADGGTLTFEYPAEPQPLIFTPCEELDGLGPTAESWTFPATAPATMDLVFGAFDGSGNPQGYAEHLGTAVHDGDTITFTGGEVVTPNPGMLELDGVSATVTDIMLRTFGSTASGTLASGSVFENGFADTLHYGVVLPAGAAAWTAVFELTDDAGASAPLVLFTRAQAGDQLAAPPRMAQAAITTIDATHAGWTETSTGPASEVLFVGGGMNDVGIMVSWTVRAPYDGRTSVALPTAPAAAPAFTPDASMSSLTFAFYPTLSTWEAERQVDARDVFPDDASSVNLGYDDPAALGIPACVRVIHI